MAAVGQYRRVLKGEDAYDSRRSIIGGEPVQACPAARARPPSLRRVCAKGA